MPANHTEIERRLWDAADELRANPKLKSSEYSVPVLGLIFLRYADYKFTLAERELEGKTTGRRAIGKIDYQARGVLYLPDEARFARLLALPEGADIGKAINDAMKAIEAEKLRGALSARLARMVRLNRSRMDYLVRLQEMIDEYNSGAASVETFFANLIAFAQGLDAEEKRAIAQNLTEEELAVFDLLSKPAVELTRAEERQVKQVAKELLQVLKAEKLVLDWRKRQQARAAVRLAIEEMLDRLPEAYTPALYRQKCEAVYLHVCDSYFAAGRSIYAMAA